MRRRGFAPEEPDPPDRLLGQPQAGIAVGPVEDEPGAQLGLGVGALVGERGRIGRVGASRAASPGS